MKRRDESTRFTAEKVDQNLSQSKPSNNWKIIELPDVILNLESGKLISQIQLIL